MLLDYLSAVTWDIDPVMLRIGPVTLRYYGVLFALALAVGYMIIRWRYKEEGEDPEKATNLTYALMAAIVIGSRLAHCLFYEPPYIYMLGHLNLKRNNQNSLTKNPSI